MKRKKLNEFVKALYKLNMRPAGTVATFPTEVRYTYANGTKSPPLRGIPMNGKFMPEEVGVINKIIKSIELTSIKKECIKINQMYGFPLMLLTSGAPTGLQSRKMILTINTKHGILLYEVMFNNIEDVPDPISAEEIAKLKELGPQIAEILHKDIAKEAKNGNQDNEQVSAE